MAAWLHGPSSRRKQPWIVMSRVLQFLFGLRKVAFGNWKGTHYFFCNDKCGSPCMDLGRAVSWKLGDFSAICQGLCGRGR